MNIYQKTCLKSYLLYQENFKKLGGEETEKELEQYESEIRKLETVKSSRSIPNLKNLDLV